MRAVLGVALKAVAGAVAFLVVGNLAILGASLWARGTTSNIPVDQVSGVSNLSAVDDRVWRGAAPTPEGYRNLAAAGVTTVVDLRAEDGLEADTQMVADLGMRLVSIPVRDGQAPSADKVEEFLAATRDAGGTVFVHCGAGVGRTGAMVGAYLVEAHVGGATAIRRNLAVGPPSLEQLAFVVGLEESDLLGGDADRPNPVLTAVSRVLDAPRRIWSNLT